MTILGPPHIELPIGISDYARLRRGGYTYVDKTTLIRDVIREPGLVKLIPRPRRFGKTLNMSTLRYFFELHAENRAELFADTEIWTLNEGACLTHFQKYPVISLSFKDLRTTSWELCWEEARGAIQDEALRVWTDYGLDAYYADDAQVLRRFDAIQAPDAGRYPIASALESLSKWLAHATGRRVVILIDEYDAPLHAAWENGYWDQAIDFFRRLLSGGLKDNDSIFRGVLTGILRVAKENIFSGLNNVLSYSIVHDAMSTAFGFTTEEVESLALRGQLAHRHEELSSWYNGYRFGSNAPVTIYNPWSVLQATGESGAGFRSHWKNTSSNALVNEQLVRNAAAAGPIVQRLLRGESFETTIEENISFQELERSPTVLWSLLTFSGYLTPSEVEVNEFGYRVHLRVPNREIESIFRTTFGDLIRSASPQHGADLLARAMLDGETSAFERELGDTLKTAMSMFDFGPRAIEAVYQAFIVGLFVHLEPSHVVRSNRESGYGRADVLVIPRTPGAGAVLELKVIDKDYDETREAALDAAAQQLRDRDYASEVRAAGATDVHQYAVVFDGKRAWVERVR